MTILALIRKRDTGNLATAIPAISATQAKVNAATVARIATVAVASPKQKQTAPFVNPDAGSIATGSRWWLIHYPDRDPAEVACCPDVTLDEILKRHPEAVAAEPFTPTIQAPSAPLSAKEDAAIRAWLAQIEETDPATIAEVIGQCQQDADARRYFLAQTANLPQPDPFSDDRRTCGQCANLIGRRCQAAKRGEIVASRNYEPISDRLHRCEGYAPGLHDPDRRHGRERWPQLIQKGSE